VNGSRGDGIAQVVPSARLVKRSPDKRSEIRGRLSRIPLRFIRAARQKRFCAHFAVVAGLYPAIQ
jgi:hypothetical protein